MSHPIPSHDHANQYPEDKVRHYPKKRKQTVDSLLAHLGSKTGISHSFLKSVALKSRKK